MNIRKAAPMDLDTIMNIYSHARQFMRETGNPTQWGDGHPKQELIEQDILQGICYVCEDSQGIQGVFALILGDDPTYTYIEDGKWLNDNPYGTIHRIASRRSGKGVAAECFAWCFNVIPNLRIDTHEDNKVMQHLVEKFGFIKCGIIYVHDGSPRVAYQKI